MKSENIENRINAAVSLLAEDFSGGKTIDEVKPYDHPDKDKVVDILEKLRKIVYPGYFRNNVYRVYTVKNNLSMLLEDVIYNLIRQVAIVLRYRQGWADKTEAELEAEAEELTFAFINTIPRIREYIETDVQAAFDGDPAAYNTDEIIYSYPGLYAILVNRIAHELHILGVPLIPRIMTEHAHSVTGIDIHPGTTIGKYFFIDHGTGIVIGETTIIGNNVKIYQGVTLGALSTRGGQKLKSKKRHPTIMDNVTIYSGASILGGDTVVGEGVVVGGNAFITTSIPAGAKVSVKSQELRYNYDSKHPVDTENEVEQDRRVEVRELDEDAAWFYMI